MAIRLCNRNVIAMQPFYHLIQNAWNIGKDSNSRFCISILQVPTMAAILQQPPASLQRPPQPPPIVAPGGSIRPAGPRLKTSPPKTVTVATAAGGAKVCKGSHIH